MYVVLTYHRRLKEVLKVVVFNVFDGVTTRFHFDAFVFGRRMMGENDNQFVGRFP